MQPSKSKCKCCKLFNLCNIVRISFLFTWIYLCTPYVYKWDMSELIVIILKINHTEIGAVATHEHSTSICSLPLTCFGQKLLSLFYFSLYFCILIHFKRILAFLFSYLPWFIASGCTLAEKKCSCITFLWIASGRGRNKFKVWRSR
jgi:hypothetical protein